MSIPSLSTYGGYKFPLGLAGQRADASPLTARSKMNEGAAAIDFGVIVGRGTAGGIHALQSGDLAEGITMREANIVASTDGNNTVNYPQNKTVPVVSIGCVYALACENAKDGDSVVGVVSPGGNYPTGCVGSSATNKADGTTRIATSGMSFDGAATAGQICKIRVVNGETRNPDHT